MITVQITAPQGIQQALNQQGDRARKALAVALTKTAVALKDDFERTVSNRVFDRPTPFTGKGGRVQAARSADLKSVMAFKDRQSRYLLVQAEGGRRPLKRFESLMQQQGVMPAGYQATPTALTPLDSRGNIERAWLVALVRQLTGARYNRGTNTATRARRDVQRFGQFLVVLPGAAIAPGVYQKPAGGRMRKVLRFSRPSTYRRRLDLLDDARQALARTLEPAFAAALARSAPANP